VTVTVVLLPLPLVIVFCVVPLVGTDTGWPLTVTDVDEEFLFPVFVVLCDKEVLETFKEFDEPFDPDVSEVDTSVFDDGEVG
jgi:hypothetical protein